MAINPLDIKGSRGSGFGNAPGIKEKLPIMWSYEYDFKLGELETHWLNNGVKQDISKYIKFKNFFRDNLNQNISIALAHAKDKNKHPHEIKEYVCVFSAKVLQFEPEIKLRIFDRL